MNPGRLRIAVPVLLAAGLAFPGTDTPPDRTPPGPRFEIRVAYTASLVHVIDSLSGASPGKTVDLYRRSWLRRFGGFTRQERALLAGWRRVMLAPDRARRVPAEAPPGACVPPPARTVSRRRRLAVAALHADSPAQFLERAAALVSEDELASLRATLERFEPRFRVLWERMAYLEPFAERLRRFLDRRAARETGRAFVRFFGVPHEDIPARLHLVGLLGEQAGTHAEAFGSDLLIEVRPHDDPKDQVQVVFHELAHDLFLRLPAERRAAWSAWFFERGPRGALAWSLSHEALPTALGQGVAERRLARARWRQRNTWYHLQEIDRYAHAIYPIVARAIERGETMGPRLASELVEVLDARLVAGTPLMSFFLDGVFAAPPSMDGMLGRLARDSAVRDAVLVRLGPGDGTAFLARFPCMPLVALLDEAAARRLRAVEPGVPVFVARNVPGARIVPGRRASGAAALWILVRGPDDAPRALERLAKIAGWPDGAIEVRTAPPPADSPPAPPG
ncbi:MAG: hypothetical protein D6738_01905 [Acidobacteria bacterium]|nr:MAG: hypothetical protein D6738_01905 [Acidobacteriota bacterium]